MSKYAIKCLLSETEQVERDLETSIRHLEPARKTVDSLLDVIATCERRLPELRSSIAKLEV